MLRKFRIKINEKEYMVEMEELTAPQSAAAPVAPAAPAPVAAAAPAPAPAVPQPTQVIETSHPVPTESGEGEAVDAPMPGNILDIRVKVGDTVAENQVVAVLEAMKMENEIVAPKAGTITGIAAVKGTPIDVGQPILFIK